MHYLSKTALPFECILLYILVSIPFLRGKLLEQSKIRFELSSFGLFPTFELQKIALSKLGSYIQNGGMEIDYKTFIATLFSQQIRKLFTFFFFLKVFSKKIFFRLYDLI